MFNKKTKRISEVPTQDNGVQVIGEAVDGKLITNIELNGQIRVLESDVYEEWKNAIPKWKDRYLTPGLQKHPGQLLTQHESEELYEKLRDQGLL